MTFGARVKEPNLDTAGCPNPSRVELAARYPGLQALLGEGSVRAMVEPSKRAVASPSIEPADSGYADVDGLHMYYEVHGTGLADPHDQ